MSIIEEENMANLSKCVDICLSTNVTYASPELWNILEKSKSKIGKMHTLIVLKTPVIFSIYAFQLKRRFVDEVLLLPCHGSDFNHFIKISMIDFEINMLRISPMPTNDERTMFVKAVVQLWKYFCNLTGLLSFKW